MKHKLKITSALIAAVTLAGMARAATLTWSADVLLDNFSGLGELYDGSLYAKAGVDLYLIYNGPAGTPFPGVYFDRISGQLGLPSGNAISFVDTYTTTVADFNNGCFSRDVTNVSLNTWSPPAADWDSMDYSFTILAIVDADGDYSSGAYYNTYTANASRFSTASGSSGTGYIDAGTFDASGSGGMWPWGYAELYVESAYGNPSPKVGSSFFYTFSTINCSVDSPVSVNGTNFTCVGWTGTGDVPPAGTSNSTEFGLYTDSSITWNWAASEYWLDVTVAGSGSLNVDDGWQPVGTNTTVIATPDPGWLFSGWSGDLTGTQPGSSLLMNGKKSITAVFLEDTDGDGLSNTAELIAGTDPTNSASFFQMSNAVHAANGFVVNWDSVTGRIYTVYWTDALTNAPSMLTNGIPYPQGSYTDTVHAADSQGFYSLQVELMGGQP